VETLTESVTQLIVIIIPLQESGGAMPPGLPVGAQGVCKAAIALADAAVGLAEDEYEEFPSIKKQIEDAAAQVRKASDGLSDAVQQIAKTTGSKDKGWDNLVEACQIISGQTILLLQIVYGAQLQKIFLAGDRALEAMKNLDPDRANSDDAQAFVDECSDSAQQAAQYAQYLREKAEDTDAPLQKKKLEDAAQDLDEKAGKMIDTVNVLLANPDDKNAGKAFSDSVEDVKNAINYAQDALRDDLKDAEDKIKQSQDRLEDPGASYPSLPRAPVRDIEEEKHVAKIRAIPAAAERVAASAEPDDPANLRSALQDLAELENEVAQDVKALADGSDAVQKKALLGNLDDLERLVPQQHEAAEKYQKSHGPADKERLDTLNDAIGDAAHNLEDAIHPGAGLADDVANAARRAEDVEDAASNDPNGLDDSIHKYVISDHHILPLWQPPTKKSLSGQTFLFI